MKKRWLSLILAVIFSSSYVLAQHGGHPEGVVLSVDTGVLLIKICVGILFLGTIAIIPLKEELSETGKKLFFWAMVLPVAISSLYFAGAIINENVVSDTGGPVHWHADYQVWVCDERIDLVNPEFPSNKIGPPLFHEHDDDRIHIEGTVLKMNQIDLGEYFKVIGGTLQDGYLKYPGKDEIHQVSDGQKCGGKEANLKVYVNGEKIEDYEDYLIYPHPYVPPGDCIIIDYSPGDSDTTDKICSSWESKGWSYENYQRQRQKVGGYTWQ